MAQGCDAALIFAPDAVSWLLNIRGTDVPKLPVVQGFAMLAASGAATLLVHPDRLPAGFAEHVGEGVQVMAETDAIAALLAYALGDRRLAQENELLFDEAAAHC